MQLPTTTQLRTAVDVLDKLAERLNTEAEHSKMQLPETHLGNDYAGRIEARTIARTTEIKSVAAQLNAWEHELAEERKHRVGHRV